MLLDAVTVNAVDTLLALLLAGLTAGIWWTSGRRHAVRYWALGAVAMAVADFSFLIRVWGAYGLTTVVATGVMTSALLLTLRGVSIFCGMRIPVSRMGLIVVAHVVVFASLLEIGAPAAVRMAVNSVVWGGVAFVMARLLWNPGPESVQRLILPAGVLACHAVFHGLRIAALTARAMGLLHVDMPVIQSVSLAESSLFTVALYAGLLLCDMRLRNKALAAALEEVKTLTGVLPICSCCKKIRDDRGEWTQLERYLSTRTPVQFSHGICPECTKELYPELQRAAARGPRQVVRTGSSQSELKPR